MNVPTRSALLALLLLSWSAGCGRAPERQEESTEATQPVITGFASVEWGTPLAEIVAKRGEPTDREEMGGGVTGVAFADTVLMRPVSALFQVHSEQGLTEGSYIVRIPEGTSCQVVYEHFHATIADTYPTLSPEERPNDNPNGDYCEGARSGGGGRVTTWTDPANGAKILLVLAPPGQALAVLYRSAAARTLDQERARKQF